MNQSVEDVVQDAGGVHTEVMEWESLYERPYKLRVRRQIESESCMKLIFCSGVSRCFNKRLLLS